MYIEYSDNYVRTWVWYTLCCSSEVWCEVCMSSPTVCLTNSSHRSDSDLHTNQTYWMEVRNVVRCIYRDPTVMLNGEWTDRRTSHNAQPRTDVQMYMQVYLGSIHVYIRTYVHICKGPPCIHIVSILFFFPLASPHILYSHPPFLPSILTLHPHSPLHPSSSHCSSVCFLSLPLPLPHPPSPDPVSRATLTSSDMFLIVHRLCSHDPHQFFQRLETLTREYLLEVKVRLLEQLSLGYSTIPLAIKFIQMLVNEYSSLCKALPSLLLLLQPLVGERCTWCGCDVYMV